MSVSSDIRQSLSVGAPALVLSVVAAIGIGASAGWTLGVFIGGLLMVTLLVPPALLTSDRPQDRAIAFVMSVMPAVVLSAIAVVRTDTRSVELMATVAVLVAYAGALAGVASVLRGVRLSATVSAALTVVIGLLWMSWPIWLSRAMNGESSAGWVGKLAAIHPGLALNLPHLGQWAEQSVAYHLTELNQSVPYAPPRTVLPCVIAHVVLGTVLLAVSGRRIRRVEEAVSDAGP